MSEERLDRLLALVHEHDPGLYAWLAPALAERRAGVDLEFALGLRGPRAIQHRDACLRAAADALDPYGGRKRWARAGALARRVRIFNPEAEPVDAVDVYLRRAHRAGRVPHTQRALHDVLKN